MLKFKTCANEYIELVVAYLLDQVCRLECVAYGLGRDGRTLGGCVRRKKGRGSEVWAWRVRVSCRPSVLTAFRSSSLDMLSFSG